MTTVTRTRRYPVDRKMAFAYLTDPTNWPDFYSGIIAAAEGRFQEPGDSVSFTYSMLGKRLEGRASLETLDPGSTVRHTASVKGIPDVHQTWVYQDTDSGVEIDVSMEVGESTSFFGKAVGRLVIPGIIERDLERTLDAIGDLFALGVPQA